MRIFNVMKKIVALYEEKIWGRMKYECLDNSQKRYIKLNGNTPEYKEKRETKTGIMVSETRRAIK